MSEPKSTAADPRPDAMIELLKTLEVFHSLRPEELELIAELSAWLTLRKGEIIFAEQDGAGRIYAIQEGEVLITKRGDKERDISLATFVQRESFGELSLLDQQSPGTVAHCERDTVLLVFPAKAREEAVELLFSRHPRIGAQVLHNLLAMVARRIRITNRLIAAKSPWVQELRRQVMLDKLTGLYNNSFLEEELGRIIEERPVKATLLMIKPDNFKTVNDRYGGHKAGDRVLQLMAAELRACLADRGIPIRYQGDVFAVVLPSVGLKTGRIIAEEVREAMHGLDLREITEAAGKGTNESLRITVSVGVASSSGPSGGASAAELVERAYENLFTARKQGGNRSFSKGQATARRASG